MRVGPLQLGATAACAAAMLTNSVRAAELVVGDVSLEFATLFTDEAFQASVPVAFDLAEFPLNSTYNWTASVNGNIVGSMGSGFVGETGALLVDGNHSVYPVTIETSLITSEAGTTEVEFEICVEAGPCMYSGTSVQAIGAGVSIIPMFLVITLAMVTQQVEVSLAIGIFVGACIVSGDLIQGFKTFLEKYIGSAASDTYNVQVILFTFFVSALVGMIERSGGMKGLSTTLVRVAKSRRTAQLAAFGAGLLLFFDDYANSLVVGFSMRPVFDPMMISREKLAFIADATAAPIASIVPISSWVGFEISLIQKELDKIYEANGDQMPDGLSQSGFTVFVQSIPYRYYPIFMIFLQMFLIGFQRDMGPMLVAERKCVVDRRTDGGDGAFKFSKALSSLTAPLSDTPPILANMLVPIALLVTMILVVMVNIGIEGSESENPSVREIFENTDSYLGLMFGSFAAALISLLFFALQFKMNGALTIPNFAAFFRSSSPQIHAKVDYHDSDDESVEPRSIEPKYLHEPAEVDVKRPVMTPKDSVEAWLLGLQRIFPAIVVLILAWATGLVMEDIGANRFFQQLILENVSAETLPTITFVTAAIMALATGTSWGTMEICFPIVVLPAYTLSGGDAELIIAVIAAVLAGAVCGDHCSPISDTTVLSSISADCDLAKHVLTQAPYALLIFTWSILVGTLPVGYSTWSTGVAIGIGFACVLLMVLFLCAPVVSSHGRYDLLTELYLLIRSKVFKSPDKELEKLKEKTKKLYASAPPGESVTEMPESEGDYSDNLKNGTNV